MSNDWLGFDFDDVEEVQSKIKDNNFNVIPECKLIGTIKNCAYVPKTIDEKTGNEKQNYIKVVVNTSKGIFEKNIYVNKIKEKNEFQLKQVKNFLTCVEHTENLSDLLKNIVKNNDFSIFEGKKIIVGITQDFWFKTEDKKLIFTDILLSRLVTKKAEIKGDKILINEKMLGWLNKELKSYPACNYIPELCFKNAIENEGGFYKIEENSKDEFFQDIPKKKFWDSLKDIKIEAETIKSEDIIGDEEIPF